MWHVIVGAWARSCGPWDLLKVLKQEIQDSVLVPCLCGEGISGDGRDVAPWSWLLSCSQQRELPSWWKVV